MIEVDIPGWRTLRLAHLVMDVNGTIALDGSLLPRVRDLLQILRPTIELHLCSGDTYGQLDMIAELLRLDARRISAGHPAAEQKAAFVRALGADHVVAIGNGANDVAMLKAAALGIAVIGPEGAATVALQAADIVTISIEYALELLARPLRLVASLRR